MAGQTAIPSELEQRQPVEVRVRTGKFVASQQVVAQQLQSEWIDVAPEAEKEEAALVTVRKPYPQKPEQGQSG